VIFSLADKLLNRTKAELCILSRYYGVNDPVVDKLLYRAKALYFI